MRQLIRLTESDLRRIIRKSVNGLLYEGKFANNRQIPYQGVHDEVDDVRKREMRSKGDAYIPNKEKRVVICVLYDKDSALQMVRDYSIEDWAEEYGKAHDYFVDYKIYQDIDKNNFKRIAASKYVELLKDIDFGEGYVVLLRKDKEQLFDDAYENLIESFDD